MEVFPLYALSTSAWLALEATPLLLTPRLIVSMTISEPRRITDLESYLCRALGLSLLVLAALLLILTNTIPVAVLPTNTSPPPSSDPTPPSTTSSKSDTPYAYPTILITTIYHALTSFHVYTRIARGFNFAFVVGITGSGALFCLGVWALVFGNDARRLSKKTGADKRTSNFPFENKESAKSVRKESKAAGSSGRRSIARRSTGSGRD